LSWRRTSSARGASARCLATCTEEWQTIASLLGIQTAAVGGFMYFLHK
jgi:hypothetical protein